MEAARSGNAPSSRFEEDHFVTNWSTSARDSVLSMFLTFNIKYYSRLFAIAVWATNYRECRAFGKLLKESFGQWKSGIRARMQLGTGRWLTVFGLVDAICRLMRINRRIASHRFLFFINFDFFSHRFDFNFWKIKNFASHFYFRRCLDSIRIIFWIK